MLGEVIGRSGLRAHQLLCTPPSHSLASRPSSGALFHSAAPSLWGRSRAVTAVPRHQPLGGAVAPPTRAGSARKAETQPNRARRGGPSAPAERALPSPPLSPTSALPGYKARRRRRRRPRPCPQLRPPAVAWFPRLWRSLAFRPARPKRGRSRGQGGVRKRERLGPGGVLPLQSIQASRLPGPWDETELPAQPPPLAAPQEPQPGLN